LASLQLPGAQEQLSKHQEGQFEWLLSVPVKASGKQGRSEVDFEGGSELRQGSKKLYFGCNLVHCKTQSGTSLGKDKNPANVYTLLATGVEEEFAMAAAGGIEVASPLQPALDAEVDGTVDRLLVPQPARPLSRIEDSVEELDKLEEQLEAIHEVAQLGRVAPPKTPKSTAQDTTVRATSSTPLKRATSVKEGANTVKGKAVARSSSVRKPTSTSASEEDKSADTGIGETSARKVPRPASLLPPKPPARSSKPPTVPTFELPGEAVARRLKEQREARRSQHISPEQAATVAATYSPSKPHVKSTKPPTRPTFELPGEAISRRKREAHEAKLRAQEEEERKRREFKARPIRANLAPSSTPRETLASLARQQRMAGGSCDSTSTTTPTPAAKKRQSMVPSVSSLSSKAASSSTQPARERGRDNQPQKQASSRGTSTSTNSINGGGSESVSSSKRSTVSAEDVQQQKLKGKEIFAKDNSYTAERERERRDREEAAKLARQEAAERSRQLSREWAEKQRARKERERAREKPAVALAA
jgi:hypothetical protein